MAKPRTPKGRTREVARRLAEEYPEAICELDHTNPFELLAATILSAQTTDARVNMVTPELFRRYPNPVQLAAANPAEVEDLIRSTGFYQNKTRNLIGMASALLERFDGEVPTDLDDLVTLPGVGRKTGNVVRSVAFGPARPAGRHPRRQVVETTESHGRSHDPVKLELELERFLPAHRVGRLQLANDSSRSAGVRREATELLRMCARRHLPVVAGAAPSVTKIAQ